MLVPNTFEVDHLRLYFSQDQNDVLDKNNSKAKHKNCSLSIVDIYNMPSTAYFFCYLIWQL